MLFDEHCLVLIQDILDEHLKLYNIDKSHYRKFMQTRLINVVTAECYDKPTNDNVNLTPDMVNLTPDTVFHTKCSINPESNLCINSPNISQLILNNDERKVMQITLNETKELSLLSCDCRLRAHLAVDPFLSLPSLILKTFQNNCPRLAPREFNC